MLLYRCNFCGDTWTSDPELHPVVPGTTMTEPMGVLVPLRCRTCNSLDVSVSDIEEEEFEPPSDMWEHYLDPCPNCGNFGKYVLDEVVYCAYCDANLSEYFEGKKYEEET